MIVRYEMPQNWIAYDAMAILQPLMAAKAMMLALTRMPYQRSWADELQRLQLKREVVGTSRLEGAEFTEKELEAALSQTLEQLETRSQRQAAAAVAMSARHVQLLNLLLDEDRLTMSELTKRTLYLYTVKNPMKALIRDLNYLIGLQAMSAQKLQDQPGYILRINLDWPTQITETEFFRRIKEMPKGKVYAFLSS